MGNFCSNCGQPIEDDGLFCAECGTPVESERNESDEGLPITSSTTIQQVHASNISSRIVSQYDDGGKTKAKKSMATAMVLTILFGPLGMLYANVKHALILIVLTFFIGGATGGATAFLFWIGSIIWAYNDIKNYNNNLSVCR